MPTQRHPVIGKPSVVLIKERLLEEEPRRRSNVKIHLDLGKGPLHLLHGTLAARHLRHHRHHLADLVQQKALPDERNPHPLHATGILAGDVWIGYVHVLDVPQARRKGFHRFNLCVVVVAVRPFKCLHHVLQLVHLLLRHAVLGQLRRHFRLDLWRGYLGDLALRVEEGGLHGRGLRPRLGVRRRGLICRGRHRGLGGLCGGGSRGLRALCGGHSRGLRALCGGDSRGLRGCRLCGALSLFAELGFRECHLFIGSEAPHGALRHAELLVA
mmetsp:Transcript_19290/g.58338  ORF Transcript_19290/g.58338 Transcript_19290/m.58338 type:complete len:270 (-) Transcript_19290:802-1611(-)